ncbi:MAG: glycosyltransferase [Halodesulfurarchaeum sp.]
MSRSVGLVVPAFRPDVEVLSTYIDNLASDVGPDVIRVEIDDPDEATLERLSETRAEIHTAERRRGKGAAVTFGFEQMDTDVLAFADADASTPASSIADVIEPVTAGEADLGIGSRRHPAADIRSHQSVLRQRLGDGFAWLARRVLDVQLYDYQCGAKAISSEAWNTLRNHLYEPGFAWDIELLAMAGALDCRIVEVPVTWNDHPESTVDPMQAVPELLGALVSARHRAKRLQGNPLHETIASHRADRVPLIGRSS